MKNVMRQTVQAGGLASESREDADGRHPLSLGFGVSEAGELNRCLPRGPFQQEPLWANPAPGLVYSWYDSQLPHTTTTTTTTTTPA